MKTLALFSLSLAVTLGMPPFAPGMEQTPVFTKREQSPLLEDWVPVQGHVVVEDPAPQVRPGSGEQKEVLAPVPVPVDMKQSMVEQEIKVKPQVKEQEGEVKTEIKKEPDVKAEPDVKEDLEADVEPEVNLNLGVKAELNADVEPEVNLNLEVKAELNADVEPKVEMEPELNDDPEFKVKSEVEPDVQEQFQVQMNLEPETETSQEIKERHIDMEGKYEMASEPIMELVPLDDDNMEPSEVEKSLGAAFQNQNPVNQPLSEGGEGLMSESDNVLDEEPIMELEPMDDDNMEPSEVEKSLIAAFQNQNPVNQPLSEGEEGLMSESDNVLDEEPIMELEPLDDDNMEPSEVEKSMRAAFQNQNPVNQPLLEEGEGLMSESDNVLDEEPIMELEPLDDDNMELSEVEKSMRAAFQNQNPVNQPLLEEGEGLMSERDNVLDEEPIMELEPLDDDNMEPSEVEKSLMAVFQNQNPVNQPLSEGEEGHMWESNNVLDEEPIMELEPMDDDKMSEEKLSNTELSDMEKSLMAAFENQNIVNQPLPEGGEGLMSEMDYVLDEEPIMELEPEEEQSSLHQQVMPEAAVMEEGPALDIMGQPRPSLSEYFPNEEARMGMEHGQPQDYLTKEEAGSEFVSEEKQPSMGLPEMEDGPDGGAQIGVAPKREKRALMMRQGVKNPEKTRSSPSQDQQGRSPCPGVILDGKCYQFFKEPKAAADAEFFCQDHVAGGHLASITSQHIHREVMHMMLRNNGALTRTWIGGLRYLKTGRFIWLDGSRWRYSDWLSGEPNNTSDVEECVEVLGNGKFNDFTCWEPQAFICSYPYQ